MYAMDACNDCILVCQIFFSSLFPSSFRFFAARAEPYASKTRAGLFNMTLCRASSVLISKKAVVAKSLVLPSGHAAIREEREKP